MYEFSMMMPIETPTIDRLNEINNQLKQSKITTLYFELPINCEDNTGFEQNYYNYSTNTTFDFWKGIIRYAIDKKFEVVYLLNNPNSFIQDSNILPQQLKKLDNLIKNLKEIGCTKYMVANTQLINYLTQHYPDIEILVSSSIEYNNINQYKNLISFFNNLKQISISPDNNKNFKLLKNLQKFYGDLEITVNDGCIPGCPLRQNHRSCTVLSENAIKKSHLASNEFSKNYFILACKEYFRPKYINEIFKSNIIYPWQIKEYAKIGIKRFSFAPELSKKHLTDEYDDVIEKYFEYLKGIEDYKSIENTNIRVFNNYIYSVYNFYYTVGDIKKYLPDIKHFIKNGHLCASRCGTECTYCDDCVKKLKKAIDIL